MARQPPRIIWSPEALASFEALPRPVRLQILDKIHYLNNFPEMYQVEDAGRWAGLRRFRAKGWKIYYTYWRPENTLYFELIVHVRSGQEE